jgi:hypothetical protein
VSKLAAEENVQSPRFSTPVRFSSFCFSPVSSVSSVVQSAILERILRGERICSSISQKVGEQIVAALGENGLRMKLDALDL